MDDKWNAFVDGTRLFLDRSRTGAGIFEAGFEQTDTGWRMVEALTEPSDQFYRRGDEDVTSDLLFLIVESVLLNRCHAEGWASSFLRLVPTAVSGRDFDLWLHAMIGNRWGEFYEETSGS